MNDAGNSLTGLQEIPLPAPVSYMPQTVGWLIVAIVVVIALAYGAWRWRKHRLANRYRVVALAELAVIEQQLVGAREEASGLAAAAALPALVKRTALAVVPRERIASLTDAAWLAFLDRTYPPGGFATGPGRLLPQLAYARAQDVAALRDADLRELIALVRRWIEHHHACV